MLLAFDLVNQISDDVNNTGFKKKKKITVIKFGLDEEMWKVKQFMVTFLIATALRER